MITLKRIVCIWKGDTVFCGEAALSAWRVG